MEISITFWFPDITNWWRHPAQTHSKYVDLTDTARDILFIIPHGGRVEASFSLGWDVIGWRQSKTVGETVCEKVVVRKFARGNNVIFSGADPQMATPETEHVLEIKKEAEENKFHRMAKIHDFWKCGRAAKTYVLPRRNLTLKTSRGRLWDTFRTCTRLSTHPGHSLNILVRLHLNCPKDPLLPPPLSASDLPGGQNRISNLHRIRIIHLHAVETDEHRAPGSISDSWDLPNWNGDLDTQKDSEDDRAAYVQSHIEQDNRIQDLECPEQWVVIAAQNVPR